MSDAEQTGDDDASNANDATDSGSGVRRYANYGLLAVLGLLAFIALIQFYLSTSRVISTWVTPEYRPLFQALFNLIVLLLAGLGISYQIRRLYGGSDDDEPREKDGDAAE
ncbi:hypothetical protein ACFQJD_12520 [Haloplanus sp. GCM10025708]|uniref:hypothetical protein n=1 Tax=Haloferacaceae TaxID=1644056 RepID=UPI003620D2FA